ncbi:MAG: DNRLRE domain-containing protein [Edaphobacter sp.]|uniref:DNRLRE domain-containing protein n=1 Tax=Edaphobacter sp. TaxID=1934404 RepID=UPI002392A3B0|nr:DNRLRE domain-containing protein [Edaphobacter sp.]MDE1175683.1 DNRLRE domain-containing protein [Edaphobacter sp.]
MKRFEFVQSVIFLGLLFLSSHEASASDVTLSGDASVNSAHASMAYGALSNLYVGNGNTTFLKFDLKTLPSGTTSAQVSQAMLTVFVNRVNTAGTVTVAPITSAWNEYGVTSATAPPIGTSFGSLAVTLPGQFVSVDVTAQVRAWLDAAATNTGFALSSNAANVLFDSKENDETGHPARLDVTLVNQGLQGIQGVPGVAGAIGPQGLQGIPGPIGLVGPVGVAGATGATGAAGAGLVYRNVYVAGTAYAVNDAVTFNGSTYVSLQDPNVGHQPDGSPTFWSVLAAAGATGVAGSAGPIGPQGSQGIQGVAGPVGPTGPTGAIGAAGPQGPPVSFQGTWSTVTNYALGDAVFFNGSSYVSLVGGNTAHQPNTAPTFWSPLAQQGAAGAAGTAGPIGPQGLQGIQGVVGPAGSTGATGAAGAAGATGPQGPPVNFRGAWSTATLYSVGDAVAFNNSSYISLVSNLNVQPGTDGTVWALLAQAGAQGPQGSIGPYGPTGATGPQGPVGPTGPAGANGSGVNAITFAMQFVNPGTAGTYYLSPLNTNPNLNSNTTLDSNFVAMPVACTMSALNVGVNNYNFAGADTTTLTVFKNSVATAMTCSVTTNANGSSCQDRTHTFSVSGGDSISLVFSETNINPYNRVTVSLVCQ